MVINLPGGLIWVKRTKNKIVSAARPAWYQETIEEGIEAVMREVVLPHDAPGGMPEYRQVLAGSLLFKAFLEISNNITGSVTEDYPGTVPIGYCNFGYSGRAAASLHK